MNDMKYYVKTFKPFACAINSGPKGHSSTHEFATIEEVESFIQSINLEEKKFAERKRENDYVMGLLAMDDLPTKLVSVFYGKKINIATEKKNIEEKIITHGYVAYKLGDK